MVLVYVLDGIQYIMVSQARCLRHGVVGMVQWARCRRHDVVGIVSQAWCRRHDVVGTVLQAQCRRHGVVGTVSQAWCRRHGSKKFYAHKPLNFHQLFTLLNGETFKLSPKTAVLTSCARCLQARCRRHGLGNARQACQCTVMLTIKEFIDLQKETYLFMRNVKSVYVKLPNGGGQRSSLELAHSLCGV